MHHKDVLVIRIGVTVAAVARKHRLTSEELLMYLKLLFPALEDKLLKRAALIGVAPLA